MIPRALAFLSLIRKMSRRYARLATVVRPQRASLTSPVHQGRSARQDRATEPHGRGGRPRVRRADDTCGPRPRRSPIPTPRPSSLSASCRRRQQEAVDRDHPGATAPRRVGAAVGAGDSARRHRMPRCSDRGVPYRTVGTGHSRFALCARSVACSPPSTSLRARPVFLVGRLGSWLPRPSAYYRRTASSISVNTYARPTPRPALDSSGSVRTGVGNAAAALAGLAPATGDRPSRHALQSCFFSPGAVSPWRS